MCVRLLLALATTLTLTATGLVQVLAWTLGARRRIHLALLRMAATSRSGMGRSCDSPTTDRR